MVLLVTDRGQKIDPDLQSFNSAELKKYTQTTKRQLGEWIRRGIISVAEEAPSRGKSRSFSFWNLLEAMIAVEFGRFAHMQLLEDCMGKIREMKGRIQEEICERVQSEITAGDLKRLFEEREGHLFLVISDAPRIPPRNFFDGPEENWKPHVDLYLRTEIGFQPIASQKDKRRMAGSGNPIRLWEAPVEVSINITRLYGLLLLCVLIRLEPGKYILTR